MTCFSNLAWAGAEHVVVATSHNIHHLMHLCLHVVVVHERHHFFISLVSNQYTDYYYVGNMYLQRNTRIQPKQTKKYIAWRGQQMLHLSRQQQRRTESTEKVEAWLSDQRCEEEDITAQYDVSVIVSSMEEGGVQEPVVDCSGGITAQCDVSENISSVELEFSVDDIVPPSDEDTMSDVIQFINPMKRCLEANSDVNFRSYFAAGVNLEYKYLYKFRLMLDSGLQLQL